MENASLSPPFGASDFTPHELWVMGSQGDNPRRVLKLGEHDWFTNVHWSPDGTRLAYVRMRDTSGGGIKAAALETCDLKGADTTVVVSELAVNELEDFCWLPERRIVYSRQESPVSGDDNLWQIAVDPQSGRPAGKPKRLTHWAGSGLGLLRASADGKRLTVQKITYLSQVRVGRLTSGGTRMDPPRRLTNDEAWDEPMAWTPDSKAVLFDSDHNGAFGIFKQAIGEDTAEPVVTGPEDAAYPRLSADGAWMLYAGTLRGTTSMTEGRLMRVPIGGGVPQFVLEWKNWVSHDCARTPASLCVIAEESQDHKELTITDVDPVKGRGRVLRTINTDPTPRFGGMGLSPDGSIFAVSRAFEPEIHIRLLSLSGGPDREITVKGWPNITGLEWAPGGQGFTAGPCRPRATASSTSI